MAKKIVLDMHGMRTLILPLFLVFLAGCSSISFLIGETGENAQPSDAQQSSTDGNAGEQQPGTAEGTETIDTSTCEGKLAFFQKDLEESSERYDFLDSEVHKSLLELKQLNVGGDATVIAAKKKAILVMKDERQDLQAKVKSLKAAIERLPCDNDADHSA